VYDEYVHPGDFTYWAQESFEVSENFVYKGFVEGELPSMEYLMNAKKALKTKMAYGSRRLAELMKDIFTQ
jgi:hypothetical protein